MANESSGKKALKAGLGYTVGNMLVKGLSFLAIPLFARLMTVEDFGIYSTFSSYVMIMTVLAVAVLWMGLYPKPFTDVMDASVANLLKQVAVSKLN